MDAQQFLAEFGHVANAPGGINRLRELIRGLAIQGKLTAQELSDSKVSDLLLEIVAEKSRLTSIGKMRRERPWSPIAEHEIRFPIPSSWKWLRFGELTINRDGERVPVASVDRDKREKIYDYYGASGVIDKIDRFLFDKTLLLVSEDGANLVNRSTPIAFLASGQYWVNNHAHVIDATYSRILRYLALFLNSISLAPYVTGTAQPKLNQARLSDIPIAVPPPEEQSRIVAKVDELMALCDQLEKQQQDRRKLQNALRQSTLQALASAQSPHKLRAGWERLQANFGRLFSEPGDTTDLDQAIKHLALKGLLTAARGGERVSAELADLANSSVDASSTNDDWQLPSHWIWARCAWLGEARLGKMLDASKNKGELRPYLRNINVRWHRFDLGDVLKMRVEEHELQRVSIKRGDLVICEGGEPGRAAIWNSDEDFVIQKALHRFRCGSDVLPEYMLFCLEHDFLSGRLARYYTGATIKHLTGKALAEYSFPLPPIAEQRRILDAAHAMSSVVATLREQMIAARRCGEIYAAAAIAALTGIGIEQAEDTPVIAQAQLAA